MSNINVTYTENTITVDEVTSAVTVSEIVNTIDVAEGAFTISNSVIRSAISNTSPILYDELTGVIGLDTELVFSNTIANAWLTTKTTDDLAEGSNNLYFTNARSRSAISFSPGNAGYNSSTGVITIPSTTTNVSEGTNLYFNAARARGNVSAVDAGGLGSFSYNSSTGAFTYTGPSDSDVRGLVSATNTGTGFGNISYNNSTGVITFDRVTLASLLNEITAGNVKLKQFSETVFDAGNQFGNVTLDVANGSIQKLDLVGNITALNFTNITAGSTVSLILRQDAIGFRELITTSFTNWEFVGNHTTLTVDPDAYDILTVTYDGTTFFASLVNFDQSVIQNSQLANSNVTINGVTVALGSSGNIDTFNTNVTINGDLEVLGNIDYVNVQDLQVVDNEIILNFGNASARDAFVIVDRSGSSLNNAHLRWNETDDRWEVYDGTNTIIIGAQTVESVNGETGVVVLDTDDISEGNTNLYYSNARVNAFIQDNITTSDIDEGDNLYFTTNRANTAIDSRVVGSENINVTSGVISLTNALGNVNSVTAEPSTNLTLNSDEKLVVTQNFKGREVAPSGNIEHEGYAFFGGFGYGGDLVTYTGNAEIESFRITSGNTTLGSNVITDAFAAELRGGGPVRNISDIAVNSVFYNNTLLAYPFPSGTYVTSIDAANNTIFMSADAVATQDLSFDALALTYFVSPSLLDTSTGQAIRLISGYDTNGSGSKTTVIASDPLDRGIYGYPQSGFDISDFDIITAGVAGDYSLGDSSAFMVGRNKLSAPNTVLQAPRGLVVGNNADLTNRAIDDGIPSFGINVLWDGTDTSYGDGPGNPLTQILLKNFTDNNNQGDSAAQRTRVGPRLFFTASEGNAAQPFQQTYPREGLELGRISWWSPTAALAGPSSVAPPAWISGVTGQDCLTTNSGVGMYFANSPNVNNINRGLYLANTKGNTLVAGGVFADSKITFAKMVEQGPNDGNSVTLYNSTMAGTLFADLGHANTTSGTGSKFSVTNGGSAGAGVVGDMAVSLNRIDNSGNAIITSLQGINYIGGTNPDRVRFPSLLTLPNGTPVTINGFTDPTVAGALNGNVFYVSSLVAFNVQNYNLYYDSELTDPVNLAVGNLDAGPGTFEFTVVSGVTAKTWDIVLEEQSDDLKIKANAVTVATITDAGNIVASNFIGNVTGIVSSISNFTTSDLAEGTNLYYTDSRARASISGTGDISYDANTGVISYIGTPGDITDVNAGDGLTGGGDSGNVTLAVGAGTGITVNADNVAVNMAAFSTTDLAEGTNLYYTDTRANSAIDARVDKAYVDGLGVDYNSLANTPTLAAVATSGDYDDLINTPALAAVATSGDYDDLINTPTLATVATSGDYDDLINTPTAVSEFTNDAGYLVAANITSLTANVDSVNGATGVVVLDTDDISEGNTNLYYTDTRANTAIDSRVNKSFVEGLGISYTSLTDKPVIPTHTSNLTNDSGFITSATANVVSVNGATGVVVLDTGDIAENGNLYFTTDRANTAIGAYQGNINTTGTIIASGMQTGNILAGQFTGNGVNITAITGANVFGLISTQVSEGDNLYFTTDRANTAIDSRVNTVFVNALSVDYNSLANTPTAVSAFTNDAGYLVSANLASLTANVDSVNGATGVVVLDTDDVAEGNTNLYYTTDRANTAIGAYQGNINTTGTVTATEFIGGGSDLTDVRAETIETTVKNISGVAIDKGFPLHAISATPGGTPEVILADASNAATMPAHFIAGEDLAIEAEGRGILSGDIRGIDTATPGFSVGDTIFVAAGGGYVNVAPAGEGNIIQNLGLVTRVDATQGGGKIYGAGRGAATPNLNSGNIFIGNGSNQSVTATLDTGIVPENGNLYFTDARANAAMDAYLTSITANVDSVNGATGVVTLNTDDIAEGTANLYYSNARVNSFIQDNITTSDIDEGTNLYYTDARANAAMDAYLTSITANVDSVNGATGVVVLDTDDIAEGSNLYYSNARVITAVETGNIKLKQFAETVVDLGNISGDISGNIDVANGTIYEITANGNITIDSLANAVAGTSATLIVTQDSTGGHILSSTMKFAGASKTLSTAPDSIDIISVFYDGATYYATLSKGYA